MRKGGKGVKEGVWEGRSGWVSDGCHLEGRAERILEGRRVSVE